MQKLSIIAFSTLSFFLLPVMASAAQVLVYPTFTAPGFHGQLKFAKDTTVCLQHQDGSKECSTGVPTFNVTDGESYQVIFTPPMGYTYTSNSACSGIASGSITCRVDYESSNALYNQQLDAALQQIQQNQQNQQTEPEPQAQSQPTPEPQIQQSQPEPVQQQSVQQPAQPQPQQVVQQSKPPVGKQSNGLTCQQSGSIILVLTAFGVDAKLIANIRKVLEPIPCS